MDDFSDLSFWDVKQILCAFHRQKYFSKGNARLCSHLSEGVFLCKHHALILSFDMFKFYDDVHVFYDFIREKSQYEPSLTNLSKDFEKKTEQMHYSEVMLFCFSLLVDFHKKDECTQYMSLALKFKLRAYARLRYNESGFFRKPVTVMQTMVGFLKYISEHKFDYRVFIKCLNTFLNGYRCDTVQDPLYSVLPEVLEAAHELRFNFFFHWNSLRLSRNKYNERSLLHNWKRYLILTRYGHEDHFDEDAMYEYGLYTLYNDENKLLGLQKEDIERISDNKFRPYQVLFLYISSIHRENIHRPEMYDKVLNVLWNTIPDPFLIPNQFLSGFEKSTYCPSYLEAWKWYSRVVLQGSNSVLEPRSLKHLTRCSIRRRLKQCIQMPYGIDLLDIPVELKRYLRLDDLSATNILYEKLGRWKCRFL